jgi:hypothetical protein
MKNIITILMVVAILLNGCYIAKKVYDYANGEKFMVSMMENGIGTETTNSFSDSIYGREYIVTYYMVDDEIEHEVSWL